MRREAGQSAAEYLGALLLVSVLAGSIAATDVGARVRTGIADAVCTIAGTACAASPADAPAAAVERAARDLEGLRVQRPGAEPHVCIVGHSYGSLVLGRALRNEGLTISDAVAVGSPGMGVDDADGLGDGFERLWAARARWDVVGNAPFHGEDPHDVGFGAIRFHTGDASGHSSYFAEGTLSLRNLGLIVAGLPGEVEVDH